MTTSISVQCYRKLTYETPHVVSDCLSFPFDRDPGSLIMLSWMSLEDMTLGMPLDHLVLVQLQLFVLQRTKELNTLT